MEISLTTPALLFPAVSLLMLAYTNRFLHLAALIRSLHEHYTKTRQETIIGEITNLRLRVLLIRNMQALGALALLFCVICMFLVFGGHDAAAKTMFGASMVLFMCSLTLSVWEIWISTRALNLHLHDLSHEKKRQ